MVYFINNKELNKIKIKIIKISEESIKITKTRFLSLFIQKAITIFTLY